MKNIKTIISHLFSNNKKFFEQRCFNKLLAALPFNIRQMISYIYLKNETLYFVLKHPGYQMEFNYNQKLINDILKKLYEIDSICKDIKITQIKSYAKFIPKKEEPPKRHMLFYKEKAKGDFKIFAKDEELKKIFLEIKEIIKKNASK